METYTRDGNTIYFGQYPQSDVTDDAIASMLKMFIPAPTETDNNVWTSYDYYIDGSVSNFMWYVDIDFNEGEFAQIKDALGVDGKYRGVYFTSYRPYYVGNSSSADYSYQDDNGYYTSKVYWFKYEPIKWQILEENSGKALLLADIAIDSQEFYTDDFSRTVNGETVYPNNYAYSTIRSWLNETFYNTAFNDHQKRLIEATTIDNSASSTGYTPNKYACENTSDNVFLLSYNEAITYLTKDTARIRKSTDYAKSQGCFINTTNGYEETWWWLRSPFNDATNCVQDISLGGTVNEGWLVGLSSDGIVPALWIDLDAPSGHTSSDWIVDKSATCTEAGSKHKECTICHEILDSATIKALGHSYGNWIDEVEATCIKFGTKGHYECSLCGKYFDSEKNEIIDIVISKAPHNYVNGVCSVCGAADKATEGLTYLYDKDTQSYIVTGYAGTETDVYIPAMYNDGTNGYRRVTSIGDDAFVNCDIIESVTIGNNIEDIGYNAFYNCLNLTSVVMGTGIKKIRCYAFAECCDLESVYITDLTAWCSISIDRYAEPLWHSDLYLNGTLVTDLVIPDGVTSINGYAFFGCTSLVSVTIPDSVKSIGEYAFCWCTNLVSDRVPVVDIENTVFEDCDKLKYNVYTDENGYLIQRADMTLVGYKGTETELTISDGIINIAPYAFSYNKRITSVVIPGSVRSIGNHAFSGCIRLTDITVDEDNIKYHSAGNCIIETESKKLVAGCKASVIPDDGSVTTIGKYAFFDCTKLISINIPNNVTSIEWQAFYSCAKLESITMANSIAQIGSSAFAYCKTLNSIYYNGTSAQWNSINKIDGWDYGTAVYTVYLNNGDEYKKHTPSDWIVDTEATCTKAGSKHKECTICHEIIETVEIDPLEHDYVDGICSVCGAKEATEGLTYSYNSDTQSYTVTGYTGTDEEVDIPYYYNDGVHGEGVVDTIGEEAFISNAIVTEVTLPESITTIELFAFWGVITLLVLTFLHTSLKLAMLLFMGAEV